MELRCVEVHLMGVELDLISGVIGAELTELS